MWPRAPLPAAEDAAALAWAPQQRARWETECLSTVTLPRCSQGWSTLGTCPPAAHVGISGSDCPIPPLNFSLGRSDILQSMFGFSCCYLSPRAALLFLVTAGWICSTSSAVGSSPGAACSLLWLSLSCFAIILFTVIKDMFAQITLATGQRKMLPARAKWDFTYFSTNLIKTLNGYLKVAATFWIQIPSAFLLLCRTATCWL